EPDLHTQREVTGGLRQVQSGPDFTLDHSSELGPHQTATEAQQAATRTANRFSEDTNKDAATSPLPPSSPCRRCCRHASFSTGHFHTGRGGSDTPSSPTLQLETAEVEERDPLQLAEAAEWTELGGVM
uniref:Pleckstrin and Sec7 domain containing n=1 Tax=Mesocestoides corti TaxID=53468 RepID=A0A5K3G5W6_MESCO